MSSRLAKPKARGPEPLALTSRSRPSRPARLQRALRPLLFGALALLLGSAATAQSYQWRDVVQDVQIQADGSVIIDDTRTLWTDEDFGEAFICVQLEPHQRITLLEGSGAVSPGPNATAYTQSCRGGTELVVRNDRRVSERRVRFHYRLDGSVDHYSDVVQWYWQIVEDEHPPVRGYQLTVTAPGRMAEPYDAYVHRFGNLELPAVNLSDDKRTLRVTFNRIPDGDGVEIRYLMDPALFLERGTEPGFEDILIDEHEVQGLHHNLLTRRRPEWSVIPLAILGLLGVGVTRQFRRVGREPRVEVMRYPFEPPSDLPPAAVSTLQDQGYNPGRMGPAFHATIMDLMRRGYGEFVSRSRNKVDIRLFPDKDTTELLPFELEVLTYLRRAAGASPNLLTHEKLRAYSQRHSSTFMVSWGKKVRRWLELQLGGELTTAESRGVAKKWAAYSALAAVVPGLLAIYLDKGASAMMIVGAAALLALAVVALAALPSWRPEVAQEVAEWQGFKRTLTDYTRMKDAPLDFFKLWDVYYAYAAALGVAEKYLKTLSKAAPLAGADEATMVRSAAWMGATSSSGLTSFSGLSSTITSLSSSLSSASGSASSGGSSSGGGGGGGGGSSGGR